jgi:sugar O-acyltransferase, sialic acid O-acetyltransferase NeuD family
MLLAIYGAHGLAREVYIIAKKINNIQHKWSEYCFIDDVNEIAELNGIKVYKFSELIQQKDKNDVEVVIAVGEPSLRSFMYHKVKEEGIRLATLIHPGVYIDETTTVGEGTVIAEGVTITANIEIGANTYVQPHAVIGHDIKIGQHTVIGSNCQIGGGDKIGDRVFMGFLSGVTDHISIGSDVIISAGAIVFRELPEGVIAVGNPARIMKRNENKKVFK